MRTVIFSNNEYYHLYNRGVDKRKIFLRDNHFNRFIKSVYLLLNTGSATQRLTQNQSLALKSKIKILCYCLMPNHYHFLVKQIKTGGITEFMHNLNTSYTKFFNMNNRRTGRLFEFTFKAKHIESDEKQLHVSRYIHLNPGLAGLTKDIFSYPWSSLPNYINNFKDDFVSKEEILNYFPTEGAVEKYRKFVEDQIAYGRLLKEAKDVSGGEDALFI